MNVYTPHYVLKIHNGKRGNTYYDGSTHTLKQSMTCVTCLYFTKPTILQNTECFQTLQWTELSLNTDTKHSPLFIQC